MPENDRWDLTRLLKGGDVAAYIGSVMNNSVSNTVIIEFSKFENSIITVFDTQQVCRLVNR